MYLIGSTRIKQLFPDFKREPKDLDYAVDKKMKSTKGTEYLYNPVLCKYLVDQGLNEVTADVLYTLKISHVIGWNINWQKHLFDINFLTKQGCKLIKPLFDDLYEFWTNYHVKNKRSNLKMSAEDFFNNAITCPIPHDDLHELLIQHEYFQGQEKPTYTKVLKDNAEVEVSEEKFNQLSFEEKCNLVREEVYVMSWERKFHKDYRISYSTMLQKFIISHAPLWEGIFILQNYKDLYHPIFNYFKHLDYATRLEESK